MRLFVSKILRAIAKLLKCIIIICDQLVENNGIDVNFKVMINFKIIIITSKKYGFISNHYFIKKRMKSWTTLDYLDRNEICNHKDKKTFYIRNVHAKHGM
jgi:hypothetical protein